MFQSLVEHESTQNYYSKTSRCLNVVVTVLMIAIINFVNYLQNVHFALGNK